MSIDTLRPDHLADHVARRVVDVVVVVHAGIALVNLTPLIDHYTVSEILDVNGEATVPAWLMSASLLLVAVGAAVLAAEGRAHGAARRTWMGWAAVAAGFVLLSADEAVGFHELAGEIAGRVIEVSWLPSLYLWVLVVAPVAAVGALVMARWFATCIGWRTKPGMLALGAIAVWMTVPFLESADPVTGGARWLVVLEETAEGVGSALMLGAVAHRLVDVFRGRLC